MSPQALKQLSNFQGAQPPEPDEAALTAAVGDPEFKRFVQAQLTWDRAMAEALVNAKRSSRRQRSSEVLGSGHVEDGNGVPHQLKEFWDGRACDTDPGHGQGGVPARGHLLCRRRIHVARYEGPPPDRARLGVVLAGGDGALKVEPGCR